MGGEDELDRMVCVDLLAKERAGPLFHKAIQAQQLTRVWEEAHMTTWCLQTSLAKLTLEDWIQRNCELRGFFSIAKHQVLRWSQLA